MDKKTSPSFLAKQLKWFTGSITALHGVNHLASKSGKGLAFWALVNIGNLIITGSFLFFAKQRYDDDAIVTQISDNCNVSQVPFPAVSICNFNLVSLRESRGVKDLLNNYKVPQADIDGFFSVLPNLHNYQINNTDHGNYSQIMDILKYHYYTMESIMAEIHQKCSDLLLYCTFNRKVKNCTKLFRLSKTLLGHCCTFNYVGVNELGEGSFIETDDDFEYFVDDDEDAGGTMTEKLIKTTEYGRLSGLFIVFDVEPQDYPTQAVVPNYGAEILINDPNDYPEMTIRYHISVPGETLNIKVEPQFFQVDNELRRVPPSKRKCWFHDEVLLGHTDRYSFETCYSECLVQTYMDYCGCMPYKYPKEKDKNICELKDLKCLNNVTVTISKFEMNCNPICYVECSDNNYSTTEDTNTILSENIPEHVTKNRSLDQLSSVHVYYGGISCQSYKLTLLMDINSFIATYGGVFSLSFGASIITVIELLYLIFRFIIITSFYCFGKIQDRKKI